MISADLIKFRSLRSTPATLLLTLVVCAAPALLLGFSGRAVVSDGSVTQREGFDPVFYSFYSVLLGQFALVVFGVLAIGGEYSSGTIRASLLAVPRRGRFYLSKALATGVVALCVALVAVPATYLLARTGLGEYRVGLDNPDMRAAFIGACLYLPLMSLFAFGVAAMVRSSAIALGVLMPLLFLGSQGLANAPKVGTVLQFLPHEAGAVILHVAGRPDDPDYNRSFGPWTGIAILALWTVLSLLGGYQVLRRKDA